MRRAYPSLASLAGRWGIWCRWRSPSLAWGRPTAGEGARPREKERTGGEMGAVVTKPLPAEGTIGRQADINGAKKELRPPLRRRAALQVADKATTNRYEAPIAKRILATPATEAAVGDSLQRTLASQQAYMASQQADIRQATSALKVSRPQPALGIIFTCTRAHLCRRRRTENDFS